MSPFCSFHTTFMCRCTIINLSQNNYNTFLNFCQEVIFVNYYVGGKNVKEFDYNFDSKELTLTFVNGRKYLYNEVTADYVVQLISDKADSVPSARIDRLYVNNLCMV